MLRKALGVAVTTLLVVAATSLASWFVLSATTGATLITFQTGSMAPSMPQGSAAVTVPVPASELEQGDVVTVRRVTHDTPVTHRVVEVREVTTPVEFHESQFAVSASGSPSAPDLASPHLRELVLQGDANATPDRPTYLVTEAHRTVFAVPRLGTVLALVQTPIGMGTLTLVVALLVVWAFWPAPAGGRVGRSGDREVLETALDEVLR